MVGAEPAEPGADPVDVDEPGERYCAIKCEADDNKPPWLLVEPAAPVCSGIWLALVSRPGNIGLPAWDPPMVW